MSERVERVCTVQGSFIHKKQWNVISARAQDQRLLHQLLGAPEHKLQLLLSLLGYLSLAKAISESRRRQNARFQQFSRDYTSSSDPIETCWFTHVCPKNNAIECTITRHFVEKSTFSVHGGTHNPPQTPPPLHSPTNSSIKGTEMLGSILYLSLLRPAIFVCA